MLKALGVGKCSLQVNPPSSNENVNIANGQTDRILVPYTHIVTQRQNAHPATCTGSFFKHVAFSLTCVSACGLADENRNDADAAAAENLEKIAHDETEAIAGGAGCPDAKR
jgi:hypothetical protein